MDTISFQNFLGTPILIILCDVALFLCSDVMYYIRLVYYFVLADSTLVTVSSTRGDM